MGKKPANKKVKPAPVFALGDRVEIMRFGSGKITELRGPFGPGGAQVYRVMYRRKPKAGYIEVLGNQLRLAKTTKRLSPAKDNLPATVRASSESETQTEG